MIYIIDDDKSVRRSFELLLRSADYKYSSYESAKEFLDNFNPNGKDFLILDVHMPEMDGCELLRALKLKNIFLPVLVMTAYDEPYSRECAKNYGVMAYMRKPIDGKALLDLISYKL